jgi:hypothetical protein
MSKTIAITGATGLIGSALVHALAQRGDRVIAFSRNARRPAHYPDTVTMAPWQPANIDQTATALNGCDVVVNLVGASIAGQRWSRAYKETLSHSRVRATQQLVTAMAQLTPKPQALISSSGSGYYGIDTAPKTEHDRAGDDFLAQLCVDWEEVATVAQAHHGIRVALIRTGVVLDREQGALPRMALPFQWYVGGPILPGTQMISWIHVHDMVQVLLWAIDNEVARGAYNACAPHPVSNRDFSAALAAAMHRPNWMPVPSVALRLLFGEMADALLIGGQAVIPQRLSEAGFEFAYPDITSALTALWKD